MTTRLTGRAALVTGAGTGIGRGIAHALSQEGARVAVAVRNLERANAVCDEIAAAGGTARPFRMDMSSTASVGAATAEIVQSLGGLDIVVHNASDRSGKQPIAAESIDDAAWDQQYQVSLGGLFRVAQASYPHLKASGHGRLVMLCSTFGYHGAAANPIYSAQKAAGRGFIKSLAREWGPDAITVNAIAPAAATESSHVYFDQHPALRDAYMAKFALGRMGRPREDIGAVVACLCGDDFGYVTSQTLHVDGGLYPAA